MSMMIMLNKDEVEDCLQYMALLKGNRATTQSLSLAETAIATKVAAKVQIRTNRLTEQEREALNEVFQEQTA